MFDNTKLKKKISLSLSLSHSAFSNKDATQEDLPQCEETTVEFITIIFSLLMKLCSRGGWVGGWWSVYRLMQSRANLLEIYCNVNIIKKPRLNTFILVTYYVNDVGETETRYIR